MTILHISDTHNLHHKITSPLISKADILIHSGDITNNGTEQEVLDFLNWFISLPNAHKIFVTGNHNEMLIPEGIDFLITHEPPIMILDKSSGVHWGNIKIRNRVQEIKPKYHLFGHAHEGYGIKKIGSTFYSNATLMNDKMELVNEPRRFIFSLKI